MDRKSSRGKLLEIRRLDPNTDIDKISFDVAECLVPDEVEFEDPEKTGPFDSIQYCVTELGKNVQQHAKSPGFIQAQVYPRTDLIQVAIGDIGIGILESFRLHNSRHYEKSMSDGDAILKALEPMVSCRIGSTGGFYELEENAGVGLTLLHNMVQLTRGTMRIISHTGFVSNGRIQPDSSRNYFLGTICVFSVKRTEMRNFQKLKEQAKIDANLPRLKDYNWEGI